MPNALSKTLMCEKKAQAMGVYMWLLSNAARTDMTIGRSTVQRGQVLLSKAAAAKELGLSYHQMRSTIDALSEAGLLTASMATTERGSMSIITICNFDCYNGFYDFTATAPVTPQVTPPSTPTVTLAVSPLKDKEHKETQKETKEEKDTIATSDLTSWMLSQTDWAAAFMHNHGITLDALTLAIQAFQVHLQSGGTMTKTKSDALQHFSSWHARRRAAQQADEQRRAEAAEREQLRLAERRNQQELIKQQRRQEDATRQQRICNDLITKARQGDSLAQEALRKYGMQW